jgi:hypothetical protein
LYLRSRFTADLITALITNTGLSTEKIQVHAYLSTALANFTIALGMKKNQVNFSADGITILLHDENTASELKSKAEAQAIESQIQSYEDTGHRYVDLAIKYIAANTTAIDSEDTEPFIKTQPWM